MKHFTRGLPSAAPHFSFILCLRLTDLLAGDPRSGLDVSSSHTGTGFRAAGPPVSVSGDGCCCSFSRRSSSRRAFIAAKSSIAGVTTSRPWPWQCDTPSCSGRGLRRVPEGPYLISAASRLRPACRQGQRQLRRARRPPSYRTEDFVSRQGCAGRLRLARRGWRRFGYRACRVPLPAGSDEPRYPDVPVGPIGLFAEGPFSAPSLNVLC